MLRLRVIPVLLLENNGLVKTTKFKNGKYLGDPLNTIKIFNEKEVDELVLLDILASKNGNEPNYSLINDIATECFMPLAYGGGIKSLEQIKKIFSLGVEKVIINSSLNGNTNFIKESISFFGSQSIVASVDIKKDFLGRYGIYDYKRKKIISRDMSLYVKNLENMGFGEILFNDVDRDGTRLGYNTKLIEELYSLTNLPTIFCGGANKLEDILQVAKMGVKALAAGSMFVLHGEYKAVLINYPKSEELDKINREINEI